LPLNPRFFPFLIWPATTAELTPFRKTWRLSELVSVHPTAFGANPNSAAVGRFGSGHCLTKLRKSFAGIRLAMHHFIDTHKEVVLIFSIAFCQTHVLVLPGFRVSIIIPCLLPGLIAACFCCTRRAITRR
jgi:hypothetical protein